MPTRKFNRLCKIAAEINQSADEVPLAAIASVISREINCPISLMPRKQRGPNGLPRAHVFRGKETGENFIAYDLPADGNARSSQAVRIVVAHELAHLLLHHPRLSDRDPSQELYEKEADLLGFQLADGHGVPLSRQEHDLAGTADLLAQCGNLNADEKGLVLQRIRERDRDKRKETLREDLRGAVKDANQMGEIVAEIEGVLGKA